MAPTLTWWVPLASAAVPWTPQPDQTQRHKQFHCRHRSQSGTPIACGMSATPVISATGWSNIMYSADQSGLSGNPLNPSPALDVM